MSDEIRSFPRWVESVEGAKRTAGVWPSCNYNCRADLVVRTPETRNVEFPGVGAKMVDSGGGIVTIEGVPFVSCSSGEVVVPVNWRHGTGIRILSVLSPYQPSKQYIAVYEGTSEADVRERCKVPEGVRLEEKP